MYLLMWNGVWVTVIYVKEAEKDNLFKKNDKLFHKSILKMKDIFH
jgi:hypothetical protein